MVWRACELWHAGSSESSEKRKSYDAIGESNSRFLVAS